MGFSLGAIFAIAVAQETEPIQEIPEFHWSAIEFVTIDQFATSTLDIPQKETLIRQNLKIDELILEIKQTNILLRQILNKL